MEKQFQKIQLNKRTIVISDIHGHLTLFKKLLKKVHYNNEMNPVIWTPNNGGSFLLWQNLQENKK